MGRLFRNCLCLFSLPARAAEFDDARIVVVTVPPEFGQIVGGL